MPLQLQIYTNIEDDAKYRIPLQTKQMNRHPNTFICKYLFIARTRFYCKSFSKKIPSTLISTFFKQTNEMLKQQTNEKKNVCKTHIFPLTLRKTKKKTHKQILRQKKRSKREMNKTIYDEIIIVLALHYHHSRVAHNSSHITILNEADKYHPSAFVPPFPLINSLFSTKQRIT